MRTNNGCKKIIKKKICRSFSFRVVIGILIFSAFLFMGGAKAQTTPNLILIGTEPYIDYYGNQYVSYNLAIENWNAFPNELFKSAPDLPPCGLNKNASRTWVDIYNASNDNYIYGFCALSASVSLTHIWFGVKQGLNPPNGVYVVIDDRRTNTKYRSNIISTSPIPTPKLSVTVSVAPDTVFQGGTSQVAVHVNTTGGIPVSYASVSVSATKGSINPLSGYTDDYGNFNTTYKASTVEASTIYTISASASKPGYIIGSGFSTITVNPHPPLNISISKSPATVIPGGTSNVTVHITTTGGASVSGANVRILATGGILNPLSGISDAYGDFHTTFKAPAVTISTTYALSSNASKVNFKNGSRVDSITVNLPSTYAYIFNTTNNKIQIKIDENYYNSPNYSYWPAGTNHVVTVPDYMDFSEEWIFYKFVNWNWSGNTSKDRTISITAGAGASPEGIYKAEYKIDKLFNLTVNFKCDIGLDCENITFDKVDPYYRNGDIVELKAPYVIGTTFEWIIARPMSTKIITSNITSITMDSNVTATAFYHKDTVIDLVIKVVISIIRIIYDFLKGLIPH